MTVARMISVRQSTLLLLLKEYLNFVTSTHRIHAHISNKHCFLLMKV